MIVAAVTATVTADSLSLVLGIASGVVAAAAAAASGWQFREEHEQRRVLTAIESEDRMDRVQTMDLPSLQAYLFDTLGSMSIREYARDHDAQRFVARAVDRVEEFLTDGTHGRAEAVGTDHLAMAAKAISHGGDLVAGLARLRLAIEMRLRDVALGHGLPAERAAGGRLIDTLRRAKLLDPQTCEDLLYAVKVGNRAVHGQNVDLQQAQEALDITRRALAKLEDGDYGPTINF